MNQKLQEAIDLHPLWFVGVRRVSDLLDFISSRDASSVQEILEYGFSKSAAKAGLEVLLRSRLIKVQTIKMKQIGVHYYSVRE